jgi:hypothetical protein
MLDCGMHNYVHRWIHTRQMIEWQERGDAAGGT